MTHPVKKHYNSARIKLLSPEDIELHKNYSITINLADTYEDVIQNIHAYNHLIYKLISYVDIEYYFEYSKMYRLHIHGKIIFTTYSNILYFYKIITQNKDKLSIEVDTIEDLTTWNNYCVKQSSAISEYFEDHEYVHYMHNNKLLQKNKSIRTPVHLRDIFDEGTLDEV